MRWESFIGVLFIVWIFLGSGRTASKIRTFILLFLALGLIFTALEKLGIM